MMDVKWRKALAKRQGKEKVTGQDGSDGRCRERKPRIIGCHYHKEVVERRVRGCGWSQSQRLVVFATTTCALSFNSIRSSKSDS
jgi:hypothetical protein